MDKKDMLELFLKNGILLSPEEFEAMDEKNYMQMLRQMSGEKESGITVITPKTGRMSCEQFVKTCNSKFEFLKDEVLKKTDAVSINKGKKVFAEATIIGRVKETTSRGFVLEDITGETEVASESKDISIGDVLGLKGFFRENRFFPNQIVWPDIPLDNNPKPFGSRITLTPEITEGMSGTIICPKDQKSGKAANVIAGFGRFGIIKISKHHPQFTVMAYSPASTAGEVSEDAAVKMIKKRTITDESIVENLIAEIPGILWLFNNKRNWDRNYRGVLIISSDSSSFAEYDGGEVIFGNIGK